ncbi:MAG: thiolase family protein [Deltaproteobacteria bacterium]|nr:thiolase family protein [Deltaproteobacteria bacterium]
MEKVVILGVGIHPFNRYPDKRGTTPSLSFEDMGRSAVQKAVKDAGIKFSDIGAAYCSTMIGPIGAGHRVLAPFGLNGMPIVNLENACAGGGTCIRMAVDAIRGGRADVVLALGVEKMPHGFHELDMWPEWMEVAGMNLTPAGFAYRAREHMERYGTTAEQLAKVVVKNRRHGVLNPNAMYRQETSLEAVLNDPMVCDPLTRQMLCAPDEGAAAMVLCTESKARQYTTKPIYIAAAALGTPIEGSLFGGMALPQIHGIKDMEKPVEITTFVANKAYEEAGVGPEDLDLVELQDTDAASEIIETELLGICPIGEAGRLIEDGVTAAGGSGPTVNVSGGLLSKGEPVGASGLAMVCELTYHLRGEAGARQVSDARVGLGHTIGMGGGCTITKAARPCRRSSPGPES